MTPEQLKASILQYAMEGKLVKQDPNDEPASELVKKIENEKNQLVEEGKIKKGRKTGAIAENEKPFDIPNSWSWIRLNAIANDIGDGLHGTPKYTSNGEYSFINGSNLKSGSISLVNAKHIDKAEYEKIKINLDKKSILISLNGTLGNLAKYNNEKVALGKSAGYVVLTNNLVFDYIYVFLESPVFKSFYTQNYTGTTIKNIPLKALRNCPIPLPPIEEQKRIVAKIEKLMPLVDEYAESYNRLQKIDNEFEDKLKQSVLQYAMEGKLVKQNPSDEPASELIKKIENEKAELVKEGKIKKSKKLPAITDDEKPFDIPNSWEWVKLGNIVDYVQRGKSPKYDKESTRYPIISQKCVQWDGIHLEFAKHLKEDFWEGLPSYRFVTKGDLLFNSTGTGTVGRVIKVTEPFNKVPVDSHVTVIRLNQNICNSYILYFLMSPIIQKNLDDYLTGTTKQKELGLASIQNIVVSLPPLEEQKRIVAKIEKIMNSINNH
ncbi:restriction endonuclease subunit S [Lactobacillus amylovorus]|uniref:restriction endonuclease subunit S n=1 Tax=Lactobacillus amylovorus TaxID=1604 RepID=UPI00232E9E0A|nr:restriction endonuclease subunit S [Lactobacillus amylovorus]MDB6236027.1 restriction endonuclease subunit S [Lactobacillus amylovorus]